MADAAGPTPRRKTRSGPRSKTSPYVGVSQYKRTGRWEAHIWDSSGGPAGKGRQLHLGSFMTPYQAARWEVEGLTSRARRPLRAPSARVVAALYLLLSRRPAQPTRRRLGRAGRTTAPPS
jgi:hypothetical protein